MKNMLSLFLFYGEEIKQREVKEYDTASRCWSQNLNQIEHFIQLTFASNRTTSSL